MQQMARDKILPALLGAALLIGMAATGCGGTVRRTAAPPSTRAGSPSEQPVRVRLQSRVTQVYHSTTLSVSGIAARRVDVRLLGATDRAGIAYEWTPYPWQRLRQVGETWRGVLPAPALPGIYVLQLRLDGGRSLLSSAHWLLRVFPRGTSTRRSFPTAVAAVRDFVTHMPGDEALVALRPWPQAKFDHRDPRLHRLFVIAYAPIGDSRRSSRLGLFVTIVRNGFHGRWLLLEATSAPYD